MSAPTIKPRVAHVPLFQGDDLAKIEELRVATNNALRTTNVRRIGDGANDAETKAKEHDDFVAEATERAVMVTLVALGRREWRDLVMAHPPREAEESDKELGFNTETLGEILVPLSLTKPDSIPHFDTAAQAEAWTDPLAHADFQRLYNAAYLLNTDPNVPKADLSSRLALIGDETSTSPVRLGEASPSSTTSDPSETSG